MSSSESIAENIVARREAESLVELGDDVCRSVGVDLRKFWVVVAAMASDRAGGTLEREEIELRWRKRKKGEWEPMGDVEAREFGRRRISYGQYKGEIYDELPLDYVAWLADRYLETLQIARYYESRRVQAELE